MRKSRSAGIAGAVLAGAAALLVNARAQGNPPPTAPAEVSAVAAVAGMPGVPDAKNLYSETAAGRFSPAVAGHLERIYVPNLR